MLGEHGHQLVQESFRSQQTGTLLGYNSLLVRQLLRESDSLSDALQAASDVFSNPSRHRRRRGSDDENQDVNGDSQSTAPTSSFINGDSNNVTLDPSENDIAEMTITALSLQRNKRALLVYHQQRLETLKNEFWSKGCNLHYAFGQGTEMRNKMTTADEAFAKGYADLCLNFKTSIYGRHRGSGHDGSNTGATRVNGTHLEQDEDLDDDEGAELVDAVDILGGGTDGPAAEPPRDPWVTVRVLEPIGEVEVKSGGRVRLDQGSMYYLEREDVENMVIGGLLEIVE